MKLYTRRGDNGYSDIRGGLRLPKYSEIFNLLGDLDELNCFLGVSISLLKDSNIKSILRDLQSKLFTVGSILQRIEVGLYSMDIDFKEDDIKRLEEIIDKYMSEVEIREFILPGNLLSSSLLHVARAICRRLERKVVKYLFRKNVKSNILPFLNRLSDLLYALAVYIEESEKK